MEILVQKYIIAEKHTSMSTILVVEDEPNVLKLVAINLRKRGYDVLEAENGQQAMGHLYRGRPDLMILDVKLPDITGWEILDRLTSAPTLSADFPVLVMTASPVDQGYILRHYPAVVEIVVKPFNIDRMITAIQHALSK